MKVKPCLSYSWADRTETVSGEEQHTSLVLQPSCVMHTVTRDPFLHHGPGLCHSPVGHGHSGKPHTEEPGRAFCDTHSKDQAFPLRLKNRGTFIPSVTTVLGE